MPHARLLVAVLALAAGCQRHAPTGSAIPSPGGSDHPTPLQDGPPAMGSGGTPMPQPTPTPAPAPGAVSFVSVTSDRVEDVSSLEAWKRSFLHDGMSDADKAQAAWLSVVKFRQQDEPAREFIESSLHPHDPIRLFNVYGYSQCDCAAAGVAALSRAAGLTARGRALAGHSVAEVAWGGTWHMLDAAYIDQFPRSDGQLASVDDLVGAVTAWLDLHPELAGNRAGLLAWMANGGWRTGPALLAGCPFYGNDGLFPAHVQGWADTMTEYATPSTELEFGYTLGYRVNVQLRRGERLTRNWSNVGRHINDDLGLGCGSLNGVPGRGDLVYSPAYGDLAPGRVGNGTHEYDVPLAGGVYRAGALVVDNIADAAPGSTQPLVGVGDAARPGVIVIRMPSSYVVLGGTLQLTARVGAAGSIVVSFSRNHGLDWTRVTELTASGAQQVDLSPWVRRLYDYRLRFELNGSGSGLDALRIVDDIQHSQRVLPALAQGTNHIHFSAGPAEGTITLEASTDRTQTGNIVFTELHPTIDGLSGSALQPTGKSGAITFPVETPGDLERLRFGTFYRARGAGDRWDYQLSFDGGQSWLTVDRAAGPTVASERFVTFDQIPAGTRRALVRFAGTVQNTLTLFDFRIDADYAEPGGGFAPIRVTYQWDEGGQQKKDVHVATSPNEDYSIACDGAPRMRSLVVERTE